MPHIPAGLSLARAWLYFPAMPILPIPSAAAEREHEQARRHPERETLELATAGAAKVLGSDHGVTFDRPPRGSNPTRERSPGFVGRFGD